MSNVSEDKLIVHYDRAFKAKFIESLEEVIDKIDGFEIRFEIEELKDSVFDDPTDSIDGGYVVLSIDPDDEIDVYYSPLEFGSDLVLKQSDVITLLHDLNNAELIDYKEYFSKTMYLHRVSITSKHDESYLKLLMLVTQVDDVEVYLSPEPSFHFSYLLSQQGHREPVDHDSFVVIKGSELTLDRCRQIYKSFIFEANSVSNAQIESFPNEPFDIDDYLVAAPERPAEATTIKRKLILCDDTEKVIDLYNKAMCCDDDEVAVLFYSKILEFVSETVVRVKVTDEARKALSSNRAMDPDANFIKELQNLFKDHSYQKDADSIKLTVQTCGYFKDLEDKVPSYIKKKIVTESKKKEWDALGYIADSITATRNSIAHAKANYRPSGKEIPEAQYNELAELLRILAQQCIRWYAAQSPLIRVK
ncbi:hypothetical protein [Vibrio nomapromontoriensis]|uniref:hypothetical protein n=1 Tax=Vibrio nomapromontoriensis TaxID=2910246 RepID=UPI003D0D2D17